MRKTEGQKTGIKKKSVRETSIFQKKLSRRKKIFYIAYGAIGIIMFVIAFFGSSFFAYQIFNAPAFNILFKVLFLSLLLLLMIQHLLDLTVKSAKILSVAVFGGNAFLHALFWILKWRYSYVVLLAYEEALLVALVLVYYAIKRDGTEEKFKAMGVCISVFFLAFMVLLMRCNFVDNMYFAWALIPGTLLAVIAFCLLFTVFNRVFLSETGVGNLIGLLLIIFGACYFVGLISLGVINISFAGEPEIRYYEITDANISTGTRQPTTFTLYVEIEGKKRGIEVPAETYYSLEIGDELPVGYFEGALGFDYYKYNP